MCAGLSPAGLAAGLVRGKTRDEDSWLAVIHGEGHLV